MTDDIFQIAIRAYLDALAKHDEQFALKYHNPDKSVEECCYYILNQVRKTDRIGFDDSEIFGMAVTYYEATELPQEDLKEVKNVRTIVNTKLEKPEDTNKTAKAQPKKTAPKAQPAPKKAVVTKPVAPTKATTQPKVKKPVESKQMDLFADFAEFDPFS